MSFFSTKFAGLEISDYSIVLTYISSSKRQSKLNAFNSTILPSGIINKGEIHKTDELKTILRDIFVQANPAPVTEKNIAVCLPDSKILNHIFVFPASLQEKELHHAIPFEIEDVLPFTEKDIYWDFRVLYKETEVKEGQKEPRQFVLFSAIIKKTADSYTKVLKSIGVSPAVYGVKTESIFEIANAQTEEDETSFVIDIGTYTVSFLIIKNKEIKFFSSLNEGGQKLIASLASEFNTTEDAMIKEKEITKFRVKKDDSEAVKEEKLNQIVLIRDYFKEIFKEARKVMLTNERNPEIGEIDKVIFSGSFINLPNALKVGAKYFPEKSLETIKPEKLLTIAAKKFRNKKKAIPESIYFTNSIGIAHKAASKGKSSTINLIPHELKEVIYKKKHAIFMALSTILMALVGVVLSIYLIVDYMDLYYQKDLLVRQQQTLEQLIQSPRYQSLRGQINQTNFELDIITKTYKQLVSVPTVIEQIESETINGIDLRTIQFDNESKTVYLKGFATEREVLTKYTTNLKQREIIESVTYPINTLDVQTDIPFSISISLVEDKLPKYGE